MLKNEIFLFKDRLAVHVYVLKKGLCKYDWCHFLTYNHGFLRIFFNKYSIKFLVKKIPNTLSLKKQGHEILIMG